MQSFQIINLANQRKRSHDDVSPPSSASSAEQSILATTTTPRYTFPKTKRCKLNDLALFNPFPQTTHITLPFNRRVPDIIIKQAHFNKPRVDDVFDIIYDKGRLTIIPPQSNTRLSLSSLETQNYFTTRFKNHTLVMLLFDGNDLNIPASFDILKTSADLEDHNDTEIRFLAVTPHYDEQENNRFNFPILLDKDGSISRFLKLLDPLGGAIYPLTSVLVFDFAGLEQVRIRLGYDCNVFYDMSEENNLHSVLLNVLRYLNH